MPSACEQRHQYEGDLEEVEKERERKYERVHDDQEAQLTARQIGEQMLDP